MNLKLSLPPGNKRLSSIIHCSGSQLQAILLPRGHLAMSEHILFVTVGGTGCCRPLVNRAREAAKDPTMHRAAVHNKDSSGSECQSYLGRETLFYCASMG